MPTLNRRADGGYFVRHFYHDHSTWQIHAKAVRFLERRGITEEESRFSTDLFMKLLMKGWIFYGSKAPPETAFCMYDLPLGQQLASYVSAYHAALHREKFDEATKFLVSADQSSALRLNHSRSTWKVEDILVYDLSGKRHDLDGATHLGVAYVLIGDANGTRTERKEYWLRIDGRWLTYGLFGEE